MSRDTSLENVEVIQAFNVSPDTLPQAGLIANQVMTQHAQDRYQRKNTKETIRRQKTDLHAFCRYLAEIGVSRTSEDMYADMQQWNGVTSGLVEGFVLWQEQQGYAIGSINVRLATVKSYCRLAKKAGAISQTELGAIQLVAGYSHKEGRNIDNQRDKKRRDTAKKAVSTPLNAGKVTRLKKRPGDTKEGRRDALIMCLLLDHGLRCGEIAELTREGLNLDEGRLLFYRKKVDLVQTHMLTSDTLIAAMNYLADIPQTAVYLFPGYRATHLSTRMVNMRVQKLGESIGIEHLSPHDCRHYWATLATRKGTNIKALQTAGGWKSPAMPLRYAEASEIANEGVKLS